MIYTTVIIIIEKILFWGKIYNLHTIYAGRSARISPNSHPQTRQERMYLSTCPQAGGYTVLPGYSTEVQKFGVVSVVPEVCQAIWNAIQRWSYDTVYRSFRMALHSRRIWKIVESAPLSGRHWWEAPSPNHRSLDHLLQLQKAILHRPPSCCWCKLQNHPLQYWQKWQRWGHSYLPPLTFEDVHWGRPAKMAISWAHDKQQGDNAILLSWQCCRHPKYYSRKGLSTSEKIINYHISWELLWSTS